MSVRGVWVWGVALVAMAGCGAAGKGGGVAAPPSNPGATTVGPVATFGRPTEVAAFVSTFRVLYPALAQGRSDEALGADVIQVCQHDLRDPSTGRRSAHGEAVALQRIPGRFERDGITVDLTTARTILAVAQGTACGTVEVKES
ncbi:hypothetical protein MXD61_03685 [Frankia sp. AgPm24]|uniref:hypothetical protein n=1 Tax=Frankia sp. AgPm24 TaxID=631128 RepID=UPI00200EC80D|nr:hypothetical protein [Frankia sp. AgPm24]MCK9921015.1 hypothetical protein [Frankia sp. AgPm24]